MGEDELLTEIAVDAEGAGRGSAYTKLFNPASRYAIVGACAVVDIDDEGVCTSCTVAVGGLTAKATVLGSLASALVGNAITEEAADGAALAAVDEIGDDVMGDLYAGVEYRRDMLPVFVSRALMAARSRAG
jgi:CO/xanthine dehydrogenase FAD-binding subunit